MNSKKGLSLIELLVVISIIGVLAGIGIPRWLGMRANARRAECFNNLGAIMKDAQIFNSKANFYPCRLGIIDVPRGVCNNAAGRVLRFPVVGIAAGEINKMFYSYNIRPADLEPNPQTWFPTGGNNKLPMPIDTGQNKSYSIDYSGAPHNSVAVAACVGKITSINTVGAQDEFTLMSNGIMYMIYDEVSLIDHSGVGGVKYP